jgi:1-acyl-sn-glycerol-3-phosphate acyltransferase
MSREVHIKILRNKIYEEILSAFKLPRNEFLKKVTSPLFSKPAEKFARIGANLDYDVKEFGVRKAAELMLANFVEKVSSKGLNRVPKEGPLLVVSNHPGTVDSVAIAASLPRNDLKIVAQNIPFLMDLPNASKHLIYTKKPPHVESRAGVVRSSIRQLRSGGAVLIFPSGQIDPDPAVLPNAREAIEKWSRSIALMLRQAPETITLVTIVSGVLEKKYADNPFVKIHRDPVAQRRMAEFIQMLQQLFKDRKLPQTNISFGDPILCSCFENLRDTRDVIERIKLQALELLDEHMLRVGNPLQIEG